jgi:nucleotide-binding universal stress UspA family protein
MIEYPKYKKVLFCTDFSENSDYAFDYAFGIAKRDEGVLHILHVRADITPLQETFLEKYLTSQQVKEIHEENDKERDQQFKQRYLNKIKDKTKVQVTTRSGREDEEIIKFAVQERVDLIVIGKQGKTGLESTLFGRVAEKVVRNSPIPVFMVPRKENSGRA